MATLQDLQGAFIGNGGGGGRFAVSGIKTLQLSSGDYIDAIIVNGVRHGGPGGGLSKILTFASDEYIVSIRYQTGDWTNKLAFTTNKGQTLDGGSTNSVSGEISGQIYAIGGWSGKYVDSLEVVGFGFQT